MVNDTSLIDNAIEVVVSASIVMVNVTVLMDVVNEKDNGKEDNDDIKTLIIVVNVLALMATAIIVVTNVNIIQDDQNVIVFMVNVITPMVIMAEVVIMVIFSITKDNVISIGLLVMVIT